MAAPHLSVVSDACQPRGVYLRAVHVDSYAEFMTEPSLHTAAVIDNPIKVDIDALRAALDASIDTVRGKVAQHG